MRYGSVCSGIEAATVAWHPRGWKPEFFAEIEAFPCAVLKHHYPEVPNRGDITRFKEWGRPSIDVLVGGTPCQSFSVAGLRKGLDDPRGNLALVFLAIADALRPRWILWENVPGVLSSGEGRDFGSFLGGLGQLGYGWAYRVLDAQYFGVPQRRRRVFVVGHLGDWRRAAAVLFERESLSWNPPPSRTSRERVAACLTRGAESSGKGGYDGRRREDDENIIPETVGALTDGAHQGGGLNGQDAYTGRIFPVADTPPSCESARAGGSTKASHGKQSGTDRDTLIAFDCKAGGKTSFSVGEQPGSLRGEGHGGGHAAVAIGLDSQLNGDEEKVGALTIGSKSGSGQAARVAAFTQNQAGDVLSGDTMPAMGTNQNATGRNTPKAMTGMSVRRLTPKECLRLQGFPDDYLDVLYRGKPAADGPKYKAVGNSMAVPVMRWIGERIEMVENLK